MKFDIKKFGSVVFKIFVFYFLIFFVYLAVDEYQISSSKFAASESIDAVGNYKLGIAYYRGTDRPMNFKKAYYHMNLSARQKCFPAYKLLAEFNSKGIGTSANQLWAYVWYNVAIHDTRYNKDYFNKHMRHLYDGNWDSYKGDIMYSLKGAHYAVPDIDSAQALAEQFVASYSK